MRYAQVRSMDISNGEGIGVSLFVQGCPFNPHCYNCFNTETWDFNGGREWTPEIKEKFLELIDRPYIKRVSLLGGECLAEENLDDVLDLVTEINKRYNFQKVDSANPCKMGVSEDKNTDEIRLSFPNKSIWIYSGYLWEECQPFNEDGLLKPDKFAPNLQKILHKRYEVISMCNVMVDGRYIDSQRNPSKKWAGSDNQRIISIPESLKQGKVITLV